jgi:hypothetical protein
MSDHIKCQQEDRIIVFILFWETGSVGRGSCLLRCVVLCFALSWYIILCHVIKQC